ncbi:MAG TPA: isoleucine--tRNA ligase [Candidatus Limnocylindria bacterium]|nr:isoleucine--tRNA ligase [Candidatus Limnocylindria bacterium]
MSDPKKSSNKSPVAQNEEAVLERWAKEKTFEKSVANRKGQEVFSFYDGPPFANGLPHFGHSLVTAIKDSLGRYKTMRGYYVERRRNGWDCHGLPVEFAIEKQLGISGKKQILGLGLDKFNAACRESVFMYKDEWEQFYARAGRWTDTEHAYATINRDYTESVWWTMQQVHEKGLLYKGFKSMPYCPRCETPLSNFELNEGYQDNVSDPSLYAKFKLADEDAYLLGWTTTPWSLPGNAAIAVKPGEVYVYAELTDENGQCETLILAQKRLGDVFKNEETYKVVKEVQGSELVGKRYEPLFALDNLQKYPGYENLYKVWPAEFVSIEDGTGVLHIAPAFGEDDLSLGLDNDFPVVPTVDTSGKLMGDIGLDEIKGMFFKKADRYVIAHLTKADRVFAAETLQHTYPFCYRCDSPLLYYAISTWFIRVSSIKKELLKTAADINWSPSHIKEGRFGKWLEGARDWAISRNRYWGAPMPVWANVDDPDDYIVVGSIEELQKLAGTDAKLDDLHRPLIDEVTFQKDGKTYKRIEEVIDCWFESGSMPVAQQHYPFENVEKFKQSFPADYIGEGLDQTRLWFYVQHVISTILFDKPAYKNVLVNGMIMAADGQKLSKRLKNYPPVEDVFSQEGADSLRLYLLSNNQAVSADYMRFNRDGMKDINRNVIGTLNNSYRFFKMYADIDGWKHTGKLVAPKSTNVLDQWMLARIAETTEEVTRQADAYKLAHAINPTFALVEDLSNWFIRRSRRRFWKSEDDTDKKQAYATLHYALVRTTQLLAPWAPFVTDSIYRELMGGESVHLSDWPEAGKPDHKLLDDMKTAREVIAEGLRQRAEAKVKVRQPLASLTVPDMPKEYLDIVAEEVNVKEVEIGKAVKLDTKLTDSLRAEGVMRDLVRQIQSLRKSADLQVDDRITLHIESDDPLIQQAVKEFGKTIQQETLAKELTDKPQTHKTEVKLDGAAVKLSLEKA